MPRIASFSFSEDGGVTSPSVCSIDWAAQTVNYPGPTVVGFAELPELVQAIRELADQNTSDNVTEKVKEVYKEDGALGLTVTAAITPGSGGSDPVVNTIQPGTAAASIFPKLKALDLAEGLETYVIGT